MKSSQKNVFAEIFIGRFDRKKCPLHFQFLGVGRLVQIKWYE